MLVKYLFIASLDDALKKERKKHSFGTMPPVLFLFLLVKWIYAKRGDFCKSRDALCYLVLRRF